jgi:hypothetical protein
MYKKAQRSNRKLRMAIAGIAGSGKTYTALRLASELGSRVALLDTERSSAEVYSDKFNFDVAQLDTHHPQNYVDAIKAAEADYDVLIVDSLSHAWIGRDGALDLVGKQGKSFNAWGKVTPLHNLLLDTLLSYPGHLIATMRMKQAYEQEKDAKGKISVAKIGLATQQRDGIDYEFDLFGVMDVMNNITIEKSRCPELSGMVFSRPGEELASIIKTWLYSEAAPEAAPEVKPEVNGNIDAALTASAKEKLSQLFSGKELLIHKFLVMRGQIKDGETWQSISQNYADSILDKPEVFLSTAVALSR